MITNEHRSAGVSPAPVGRRARPHWSQASPGETPGERGRDARTPLWIAILLMSVALAAVAQINVPDAEQFVGRPQGAPITDPDTLHQRTQQVAALLRCPVCQGLSVADSPSEMAVNMKGQVRELLARGYTQEQILSFFERSYGQFVLLKPKFKGVSAAVWILPLLALAIGVVVVFSKAKKLEQPKASANGQPPTADEPDPYLARVRELVEKP
jgi:cytochrome c-type biogenesis protein CcmH